MSDSLVCDGCGEQLCDPVTLECSQCSAMAEVERLRAENAKLRQTLSHLLLFARGNEHVLGIIHEALDTSGASDAAG